MQSISKKSTKLKFRSKEESTRKAKKVEEKARMKVDNEKKMW
jgi:hypothetical protein